MTISYPGVMAAAASILYKEFLALSKKCIDESRAVLIGALDELGFALLPLQTNFVFHKIPGTLEDYRKDMLDAHVVVGRFFPPSCMEPARKACAAGKKGRPFRGMACP